MLPSRPHGTRQGRDVSDVTQTEKDYVVLRELAVKVREVSEDPRQQERIQLWKQANGLKPARPMVLIDQIPWHEMNVDDELTLLTHDPFCRKLEWDLRTTLYKWNHFPVDMVVPSYVDIPMAISGLHYGLQPLEQTAALDAANDVVGHFYHDQLRTEADLEKIKMPQVVHDRDLTARRMEMARDIFQDILAVRPQGAVPNFALWDRIVEYRGAEAVMYDLVDRPDFIHKLVSRMQRATLAMVDQLEEQGLLPKSQLTVHCSGAHSHELPAPGYDCTQPRMQDIWTFGMAQIFAAVSKAMHEEFDLQYAEPFYARSGLVYYGCCEPLDEKLDRVRKIPNLRKISISPWADPGRAAEQIGDCFVLSRKPSPAYLTDDGWDEEEIRRDISFTMEVAAANGCPLEFILKDISTVNYKPQRLWRWSELVMELVQNGA